MKKKGFYFFISICALVAISWVGLNSTKFNKNWNFALQDRDTKRVFYDSPEYKAWDIKSASENVDLQEKKAYTIMIYMNGSDLESENGAATDDIIEILDSGVDTNNVNIVIFTGGTHRWQNDVIPENECVLWKITDGELEKITGIGLYNMGNPGTLGSFIDFSFKNYPADKYGLILWDHGGGSIAGYGHDEKFTNGNLTLADLEHSFKTAITSSNKLEFLGFDSCLMATVEMAVLASEYAEYLIASEDLEPGDGWDYSVLSVLNDNPEMDGGTFGIAVAKSFMDYYGKDYDEMLTMSVVDLSNVDEVMSAVGDMMEKCSEHLTNDLNDQRISFASLAKKRYNTKTFGEGTPRDNDCDMVDIGDMALKLSDIYPKEAERVISALEKSVIYNTHNSDVDLKGLSVYYIYGGRNTANISLPIYSELNLNDSYSDYLYNFASILINSNAIRPSVTRQRGSGNVLPNDEDIMSIDITVWQPVNNGKSYIMTGIRHDIDYETEEVEEVIEEVMKNNIMWPCINGRFVCLYRIKKSYDKSIYAVPAEINGNDCDIAVLFSSEYPSGKILGARKEDGFIVQKGYDLIKNGDEIAFYYQEKDESLNKKWYKGDTFTVDENFSISHKKIDGNNFYCSMLLKDYFKNEYYLDIDTK